MLFCFKALVVFAVVACFIEAQAQPSMEATVTDDVKFTYTANGLTASAALSDLVARITKLEDECARKIDIPTKSTISIDAGGGKTAIVTFGSFKKLDTLKINFGVSCDNVPGFTAVVTPSAEKTPDILVTTGRGVFDEPGSDVSAVLDGAMVMLLKTDDGNTYTIGVKLGNFAGCVGDASFDVSSMSGTYTTTASQSLSSSDGANVRFAASLDDIQDSQQLVVIPLVDEAKSQAANNLKVVSDKVDQLAGDGDVQKNNIASLGTRLGTVESDLKVIASHVTNITECAADGNIHDGEGCVAIQKQCDRLSDDNLPNGKWDGVHIAGSTTLALCDDGYYAEPKTMKCTVDGEWELPTPQCKACPSGYNCETCEKDKCLTCSEKEELVIDNKCQKCSSSIWSNVLLNQKFTVSSVCYGPRLLPKYLNDGNGQRGAANQNYQDADYYHSCDSDNQWAEIEVANGKAFIKEVLVHYRCDCCASQNTNVQVYAKRASDGEYVKCGGRSTINEVQCNTSPPGYTRTCDVEATHIKIIREQKGYLVLPEVQAFGC